MLITAYLKPLKPTTTLALKQENHTVSRDTKLSILFDKTVQGESQTYVKDAVATGDGGHIILGESGILLIKIDDKGNKLWRKSFINKNDKVNDLPYAITATKDGGYTVLMYTVNKDKDYEDVSLVKGTEKMVDKKEDEDFKDLPVAEEDYKEPITSFYREYKSNIALLKVDERGNKLWRKDYNIDGYVVPNDIKVNEQGEYLITGHQNRGKIDSTQVFVLKADSAGNKIWHKNFGGKGWDEANSLIVTNDGGYIIAGSKQTVTAISDEEVSTTTAKKTDEMFYNYAAWVFKIDSEGQQIWEKTFYSKENEQTSRVIAITPTKNGEYVLVGTLEKHFDHYSANYSAWSAKIDGGGQQIWHKTFKSSSSAFNAPVDIISTTNDEYIVIGNSMEEVLWRSNGRMIKLDTNGNQLLDKTFKYDNHNSFNVIVPANDNQYLIVGSEHNPNGGGSIRIIKIADR